MFIVGDIRLIVVIIIALLLLFVFKRKFKRVKRGNLSLVSGGVKTGKTTLAVYFALKDYKKNVRKTKIINFFRKLFKKKPIELPLLYSNIPIKNVPYVPLTLELLMRNKRFVYGSTILCSEASLVADSQLIRDQDRNTQLLLFNKLIAHETKGGNIIYDTQCISDLHYSIKRCLSEYIYIHHCVKWIPFFIILKVREERYQDEQSVLSVNEDVENSLKTLIIPKSVWKKFDCYCYSVLTDDLEVSRETRKTTDLKAREIVSFRDYKIKTVPKIVPKIAPEIALEVPKIEVKNETEIKK